MRALTPQPLPDEFAHALERAGDRLAPLISQVTWYDEVTSTNDVAVTLAESGAAEGVVVVADGQTAGRGRQGRAWASPAGAGIYATVVIRPAQRIAPLITIAAGVAVAEGIESATGLPVRMKWPNDVVVPAEPTDRKLAGILAEGSALGERASWVVLGFGINVLPAAFPADVALRATSLESELGRPVDRGLVLAECLSALANRYRQLRDGHASTVVAAWRARASSTFGRAVEWDQEGRAQRGIAHDVDSDGALLVRTEAGVQRVISGEVRWT